MLRAWSDGREGEAGGRGLWKTQAAESHRFQGACERTPKSIHFVIALINNKWNLISFIQSFIHSAQFHWAQTSTGLGARVHLQKVQTQHVPLKGTALEIQWGLSLPAPEQLLSSSLGAFPSFPEGTQPIPKLPGAYSSLCNLTAGFWSSSRAQLLGLRGGRQLCEPTGLAWPPRSSPQRRKAGSTAHLATAGHWEVKLERAGVNRPSPSLLNSAERGSWGGIRKSA